MSLWRVISALLRLLGLRDSEVLGLWNERLEATYVISSLGQQPVPECRDFGEHRPRLGADDPVGLGQSQSNGERSYETTVDEVPRRKRGAGECDALAVDSGIYDHAGAVQDRSVREFGINHAGGLEPFRPVLSVIKMQQRKFQHVGRLAHPL